MESIAYVLVFIATFLAAEGVFMLFGSKTKRRARVRHRLRRLAARLQTSDSVADETLLRREGERIAVLDWIHERIPGRRALELRLYRAGLAASPARFVAVSALIATGGFVAGAILRENLAVGAICALGGLVPWMRAALRANKRTKLFQEQFPEALELMTRALRAGHSLTFAFQLAGEEMPDPIGPEFAQLSEELKFGQDLRVALANLSYRTDAGDLPFFITAIMVQRETGGNLAELLDNLGYVIRDRFKLFGKVRSLTSVGKVTANILGAWPLLMIGMLMMVGADFVEILWTTPTGHLLSLGAAILVTVGYVGCRRAAVIKV